MAAPIIDSALRYAARGWPVFPVWINKHPCTEHGLLDATTDELQIVSWWREDWPMAGVAIVMGKASGMFALDVDVDKGGEESLSQLIATHGPLPETACTKTGSGGRHLLFRLPPDREIRNATNKNGIPGIDVRGEGGYVVAPPSLWQSKADPKDKRSYSWLQEINAAEAPEWLIDFVAPLTPPKPKTNGHTNGHGNGHVPSLPDLAIRNPGAYGRAALERAAQNIRNQKEGTRNDTLYREACGIANLVTLGCIPLAHAEEVLQLAGEAVEPKAAEVRRTIASAFKFAIPLGDPLMTHLKVERVNGADAHPVAEPKKLSAVEVLAEARAPVLEAKGPAPSAPAMIDGPPPLDLEDEEDAGGGDNGGGDDGGDPPQPPTPPTPPPVVPIVLWSGDPVVIANKFIDLEWRDENKDQILRYWRNEWWRYRGGTYRSFPADELHSDIWEILSRVRVPDKEGVPKAIATSITKVHNVEKALTRKHLGTMLAAELKPPLDLATMKSIAQEVAVCQNGLLDLRTGELTKLTPNIFSTTGMEVPWIEGANPRPPRWTRFLEEVFGDDWKAVELLQEWFGYCLTTDTAQQKMLMMIGLKRSGKGTIARVLAQLLGSEAVIWPKLSSLQNDFGLQPFIGKSLAVFADVRLSSKTDQAPILESMLSITGEDAQTINRKNKVPITVRLQTRIMVLSNELPRLTDAAGAFASRIMMLTLGRSFFGKEDTDLERSLTDEMPGILAWAVEGWRRLQDRGHFVQPESAGDAMRDLEELSSPVRGFIEECCELGEDLFVETGLLYDVWKEWSKHCGLEAGSKQTFGRNLRAAAPGVDTGRRRAGHDGERTRFYNGIQPKSALYAR